MELTLTGASIASSSSGGGQSNATSSRTQSNNTPSVATLTTTTTHHHHGHNHNHNHHHHGNHHHQQQQQQHNHQSSLFQSQQQQQQQQPQCKSNNCPNQNCHLPSPSSLLPHVNLDDVALKELLKKDDARAATLLTSVKVGSFKAFEKLCNMVREMEGGGGDEELGKYWSDGHTLAHWAAKRESPQFLSYLSSIPSLPLSLPSLDSVGMTPLHWACTTGIIPNVHLLLSLSPSSLHTRDASQCTPLLIAAQYGHATLCAYLAKHGADTTAVDKNGDDILQWASYKGCTEVVGLSCWLMDKEKGREGESYLGRVDKFGQCGLHLASLRGNVETVNYILEEAESRSRKKEVVATRGGNRGRNWRRDNDGAGGDLVKFLLNMRDKDGKTPLDLAIKKKKVAVELLLRDWDQRITLRDHPSLMASCSAMAKQMLSFRNWKLWMGIGSASNASEASFLQQKMVGPMSLVMFVLVAGTVMYPWKFLPLAGVDRGYLWDHPFLHMLTLTNLLVCYLTFFLTYKTDPGTLSESNPRLREYTKQLQRQYESTIDSYATSSSVLPSGMLCHSCHIYKPQRSKHCRVQRKCVLLFDHYCPFVGNTVGLYNYKYFYIFLLTGTTAELGFFVTWLLYLHRNPTTDWLVISLGGFISLMTLALGGMFCYHTQLIGKNLTTNEHQNWHRYAYLKDERGLYRNDYNRGCLGNLYDKCFPVLRQDGSSSGGSEERVGLVVDGAGNV